MTADAGVPAPPAPPPKRRHVRDWSLRRALVAIAVVFLLDVFLAMGSLTMLVGMVAFGWIPFVRRVALDWHWSPHGIASFVALAALLVVAGHAFARRIARGVRPDGPAWPWRSTLRLAALVVIIFLAGISAVGVVHQCAWIARDGILSTSSPYTGTSAIHGLEEQRERRAVSADEARAMLRTTLSPSWRIVVLPHGDRPGAIVLADERAPADVVIALPDARRGGRLRPDIVRRTSIAEQVSVAAAAIAAAPPAAAVGAP